MKTQNRNEAWSFADKLFPTDYEKDPISSECAGYDIYRSTSEDCNAWISDLGCRLEINLPDGETFNIWIESQEEKAEPTEKYITFEIESERCSCGDEIKKKNSTSLSLSVHTTLKEIASFERDCRRMIRNARSDKNHGFDVSVSLCVGKYAKKNGDITQVAFERWYGEGDCISIDGLHLVPDERYNEELCHDMWLTGTSGELFDEMTI